MKNLFLTFVCAFALLSVSCIKDEDTNTPPQNYFEFIVSDSLIDEVNANTFIILNSSDGEIIKFQEILNNHTYRFDLPEYTGKEKYTIQILFCYKTNNLRSIECYLDVNPQRWHLNSSILSTIEKLHTIEKPSPIGTDTIVFDKSLMADFIHENPSIMYQIENTYSRNAWKLNDSTFKILQYCNPDNLFIALRNNNNTTPLYKWFDKVELNATYNLSRKDFDVVTDSMNISFPNYYRCRVLIAKEEDPTYYYNAQYKVFDRTFFETNLVKVFYPRDMFTGFWTWLACTNSDRWDGKGEIYVKRSGNIPSTFKQIKADMQFNNLSLMNFSATSTGNADFGQMYWCSPFGDLQNFEYNVLGSLNSISHFSAPKIPDYLIDSLKLNLNELNYPRFINLVECDVYSGFDDYIKNKFIQPNELYKRVNEYQMKRVFYGSYGFEKLKIDELEMMEIEGQMR